MLIGLIIGIVVTLLNSKKRSFNSNGVIDSLGSFPLFFVSSFIGAIYSAVLYATQAYGADDTIANAQVGYDRLIQGGFQLAGLAITIGIAALAGVIIGLFWKL